MRMSAQEAACKELQFIGSLDKYRGDIVKGNIYNKSRFTMLTVAELDSLATGATIITLELASRFLADYLIGDKYFRIDDETQKLRRAQAQLVLFKDMMAHMDDMKRIIKEASQ